MSQSAQAFGVDLAATRIADGFKGQLLPFVEVAEAGALNRGDVDEHVIRTVFRLNEAEALGGVEPLDGTNGHGSVPFLALPHTACGGHQIT